MADYRGIEGVSKALVHLLQLNVRAEDFGNDLHFQVYLSENFQRQSMTAGVSLFLYRVEVNGVHRIPSGGVAAGGMRRQSKLPLDLHYIMSIWGRDPSLQHRVAGWMMRTFEDTPVIPYNILEAAMPGVFRDDETVEIVHGRLSNEDMLRLWETLTQDRFQLSIPYIVRNVHIESNRFESVGRPVQERLLD